MSFHECIKNQSDIFQLMAAKGLYSLLNYFDIYILFYKSNQNKNNENVCILNLFPIAQKHV